LQRIRRIRNRRPSFPRDGSRKSPSARRKVCRRTRMGKNAEARANLFMSVDPKRTVRELKELRALTADDSGAQRVAWTDTWLQAREWFTSKLADLPVEHHYDAAGNHWVTLRGESERALLLGGHLDSVPNGGWLDGCLDEMAALEVLRGFGKKYNGRPPISIRVVDWADEEDPRFGRSLLGSSAFAGTPTLAAGLL